MTTITQVDREAAWKKLRGYCTNGLPFYDNEDGWRAIANAVLRAAEPAQVCRTCGVGNPADNVFCSDGFHAPPTEPAQVGDADRAFELWFFRDIVDDQRSKLIALMLGGAVAKEATNHGTQRLCLKYILKALRAQGRAEAQAECVALREAVLKEAARLVERRMEQRFEDYGTHEPDTSATYYEGRAGETYEALDEEDEAIATAIRALAHRKEGA